LFDNRLRPHSTIAHKSTVLPQLIAFNRAESRSVVLKKIHFSSRESRELSSTNNDAADRRKGLTDGGKSPYKGRNHSAARFSMIDAAQRQPRIPSSLRVVLAQIAPKARHPSITPTLNGLGRPGQVGTPGGTGPTSTIPNAYGPWDGGTGPDLQGRLSLLPAKRAGAFSAKSGPEQSISTVPPRGICVHWCLPQCGMVKTHSALRTPHSALASHPSARLTARSRPQKRPVNTGSARMNG